MVEIEALNLLLSRGCELFLGVEDG
jgi:hypothetical protein